MKHYSYDMPKETYDFIIKKGILRESRKEKNHSGLMPTGEKHKRNNDKHGVFIQDHKLQEEGNIRKN